MKPGPELNAFLAEKLFGLTIEWIPAANRDPNLSVPMWVGGEELPGTPYELRHFEGYKGKHKYGHVLHSYSSDITEAMKVAEKIVVDHNTHFAFGCSNHMRDEGWYAQFDPAPRMYADIPAEAIAMAAAIFLGKL